MTQESFQADKCVMNDVSHLDVNTNWLDTASFQNNLLLI